MNAILGRKHVSCINTSHDQLVWLVRCWDELDATRFPSVQSNNETIYRTLFARTLYSPHTASDQQTTECCSLILRPGTEDIPDEWLLSVARSRHFKAQRRSCTRCQLKLLLLVTHNSFMSVAISMQIITSSLSYGCTLLLVNWSPSICANGARVSDSILPKQPGFKGTYITETMVFRS